MFDDPKKSLRRLEEELWDAEYGSEEEAEEEELEAQWPEDIFRFTEDDDLLQDARALLEEDEEEEKPPRPQKRRRGPRNDAVNFHRTVYADEEMDENSAVFVEKKKKKKAGKGCGCLPVILLLELAGIAGLVWWWLRWLS